MENEEERYFISKEADDKPKIKPPAIAFRTDATGDENVLNVTFDMPKKAEPSVVPTIVRKRNKRGLF